MILLILLLIRMPSAVVKIVVNESPVQWLKANKFEVDLENLK